MKIAFLDQRPIKKLNRMLEYGTMAFGGQEYMLLATHRLIKFLG